VVRRHHLSKKKIKEIKKKLAMEIWIEGKYEIVENEMEIILVDGLPSYFLLEDKYYPTVLLLLQSPPVDKYVTVDMGAVKHVLNGANIFAAGIVEADENIREGDAVYIRDEKYKKPLAVGIALMNGKSMVLEKKGIAVRNIHHYGDKIHRILD